MNDTSRAILHIVGGGLAGSEAAWRAAQLGVRVKLYEMRPSNCSPAHSTDLLGELVCSNSFRSDDPYSAVGLLHEEMRKLDSIVMQAAEAHKVPAGSALAVDRVLFSKFITDKISSHPMIEVERAEVYEIPEGWKHVIIASGPLTSDKLSSWIAGKTSQDALSFYDALSPTIYKESINTNKTWTQSRYDKGSADYINCPLSKDDYNSFIDVLLERDSIPMNDWEVDTPYFEGCLPIEIMASRGRETLRFGPLKPIGLTNPRDNSRPYAVVQLRQDNSIGSLWSMVGFQTKLKHKDQKEVFRMIPGLENAEFARLGGIHRNSYIDSPKLLNSSLQLLSNKSIRFAGQITGVEGYVESSSIGIIVGDFAAKEILDIHYESPPRTSGVGALISHITDKDRPHSLQPMNVNFGLFPELEKNQTNHKIKGKNRKIAYVDRARKDFDSWLKLWHKKSSKVLV